MNWLAIVFAFTAYAKLGLSLGAMPERNVMLIKGQAGQAHAAQQFQVALGVASFLAIFKGLKFTNRIPVMASIGRTFGRAIVPCLSFGTVLAVLIYAYAVVFNCVFCTSLPQFGTLRESIRTITLNGLMGAKRLEVGALALVV